MDTNISPLKDIFHVAGDAPDPDGTGLRGVSPGYNMTNAALGHPMILYRAGGQELLLEADVYALPGEPMRVHLLCPRCLARGHTQGLNIRADHKAVAYDVNDAVPVFPGWTRDQMTRAMPRGAGGRLSVEAFACTWEEDPTAQRASGVNGLSICGWRVKIDDNVARDVR